MDLHLQPIDPYFNPLPETLFESWASLIDPDGVECTVLDENGHPYDN
jgi:hypothetical protein